MPFIYSLDRKKIINNKKLDIFNCKHIIRIQVLNMIINKTIYTKQDIIDISDNITKLYNECVKFKLIRSRITKCIGNKLLLFKFNVLLKLCNKKILSDKKKKYKR
jgi:hypothetical protein